MSARTKTYFASDFHLGAFPPEDSKDREKRIVRWLDAISQDAKALYLLGDVFDFWFEYATVVPRGYVRFLGKLAELADAGVRITLFKGNHDMWMFSYFKEELRAHIIANELILNLDGKRFFLHHGDGLGPGDTTYKFLKKIFRSPLCQWLFARLHPNLGIGIARKWSKRSRLAGGTTTPFMGEEKEWLFQYALTMEKEKHSDYYIFGHRHLPYHKQIQKNSHIVNLGEWVHFNTYAVWDGTDLKLHTWE